MDFRGSFLASSFESSFFNLDLFLFSSLFFIFSLFEDCLYQTKSTFTSIHINMHIPIKDRIMLVLPCKLHCETFSILHKVQPFPFRNQPNQISRFGVAYTRRKNIEKEKKKYLPNANSKQTKMVTWQLEMDWDTLINHSMKSTRRFDLKILWAVL